MGGVLLMMLFHSKVPCFDSLVQTLQNINSYAMGDTDTAAIINQADLKSHAVQEMRQYTAQIITLVYKLGNHIIYSTS